ncbi:MAG: hypothetical protein C0402_08225 [Thermodesulfovibrio sp.]|nr:hypothetical protein [Thermodesulfovibrio sp.]
MLCCPYFILTAHAENITVTVEKTTSLIALIEEEGYSLEDDRIEEFLRAFVVLNEDVPHIGHIPSGSTVILPTEQLTKRETDSKGLATAGAIVLPVTPGPAATGSPVEMPGGPAAGRGPSDAAPAIALCDNKDANLKEVATFKDRESAEKFTEETGKFGYKLHLCRHLTEDNRSLYRVSLAQDSPLKDGLQQASEVNSMNEGTVSGDIFGKSTKFYHPFISMTAFFSDNILNTGKAKKSDFFAVLSPGIWLELPYGKKTLRLLDSSTKAPGGYIIEMLADDVYRHVTASLFYQADIDLFSRYSSENTVRHRLEGAAKYKFNRSLSLAVNDQFLSSHDVRGVSASEGLDKYRSNLFDLVAAYNTGRKTLIRAGYTNFFVDYTSPRNAFRDRVDNAFTGAFFYKTGPKTSLFGEYQLINISYDSNSKSDSKEHLFWLGLDWNATAKTRGIVKAGYGNKHFASVTGSGGGEFILEGNVEHTLTSRMTLTLKAWRKTNESDSDAFRYLIANSLSAGLTRQITPKLSGYVNLVYSRSYYRNPLLVGADVNERSDSYYSLGLGAQYRYQKWMTAEAGYMYYNRNSNFAAYDYSSNVLYFKCNLSP